MKNFTLIIFAIIFLQGTLFAQAPVPDFTQTDCDGVTHHLYDDLAAGKAVVLNFCAGWCHPCRIYDPLLEVVNKDYNFGNCNVNLYSFIMEGDTSGVINTSCVFSKSYAQQAGMTFPVFANAGSFYTGMAGTYFSQYGLYGIPAFLIILPNKNDPGASEVKVIVGGAMDLVGDIEDSLALGGFPPNKINITGELCSDQPYSAQLSSNFATGNLWSTDQVVQPIADPTAQTITVNTTGTYTLTQNVGCSSSKYIEFNPLPVVGTASSSTGSICPGGVFTIDYTIPPGGTTNVMWQYYNDNDHAWHDLAPAGAGPITISAEIRDNFIMTDFRVVAASGSGTGGYPPNCTTLSNQVSLAVNWDQQPATAGGIISSSQIDPCKRDPYTLSYSGNEANAVWEYYDATNLYWQIYGPVQNGSVIINNDGSTGDSWRVIVPAGDCFAVSNQLDNVDHIPNPAIVANCDGTLSALDNSGQSYTYLWSPGGQTTQSIANPQTNVQYTVEVSNEFGCKGSVSQTFTSFQVKTIYGIAYEPAGAVCPGTPVTVHFTGTQSVPPCTNAVNGQFPATAFTFAHLNDFTGEVITDAALNGQYSVVNVQAGVLYDFVSTLTDGSFTDDNVTVTDNNGSAIYATGEGIATWFSNFTGQVRFYSNKAGCAAPDQETRIRSAFFLNDWNYYNIFTWLPGGGTSPSIVVSPQATTTYTLLYTNFFGCQGSFDIEVKVGTPQTYYKDFDNDGFGDIANPLTACDTPNGYVLDNTDCNDADGTIHAPVQYYVDKDKDSYGSTTTAMLCSSTAPVGYSINNTDCNDNDAGVHTPIKYYLDKDRDGYGSTTSALFCSSTPPVGYSSNNADCNDKDASIHGPQTYYRDADGDGYGNPNKSVQSCSKPKGYVTNKTDCDDTRETVYPGAQEICGNGIDDNCNGQIDENCIACGNGSALSTTNITASSAVLNWVAASNPLQWQLQYKTSVSNAKWINVTLLAGSVRTLTLTNLVSGQGYSWRIRAKCGAVWTSYSSGVNFKTLTGSALPRGVNGSTTAKENINDMAAIRLYPNPTAGQFMLELHIANGNNSKAQVQLIDMFGRTVYSENINLNNGFLQKQITVSSALAHGTYLVKVVVNDKIYKSQVIYAK